METKRILWVEDDNFARELYQHEFEKAGYYVTIASDGPKAIETAKKYNFDIVVLDIIIPGFDGFHVLEKLKDYEKTANIPTLVLTNLEDQKYLNRAMKLGAREYLVKSLTTPTKAVKEIKNIIG